MILRYLATLSLSLLFFCLALEAQSFKSEMYYQEDGLPNDLIKSIEIDSMGFVWVATDDGIVKIQGKDFLQVQLSKSIAGNFKQLLFTKNYGFIATSDEGIYAITEDFVGAYAKPLNETLGIDSWEKVVFPKTIYESEDHSVWFGGAWDVFQLKNDSLIRYDLPDKNYTDHFSRNSQFFEIAGKFFVITQPGYLYELDQNLNSYKEIPFLGSGISVNDALRVSQHGVMLGTENGLMYLEFLANGSIKSEEWIYELEAVSKIVQLSVNEFLIGTWKNGLKRLWKIGDFNTVQVLPILTPGTINDIEISNDGQYWIGTDVGLQFIRGVPFGREFENLTSKYIQDILMLDGEQMYFSDGDRVYFYDLKSEELNVFFSADEGLILRICEYNGGIAMSTSLGQVFIKYPDGGMSELDFSEKGRGIYSIQSDLDNNLWLMQERGEIQSLIKWNKTLGEQNYTNKRKEQSRLGMLKISEQGKLFVGGYGSDTYLYEYDKATDSLVNLSHTITLDSDKVFSVYDMIFESDGELTLATEFGVWEWNEEKVKQLDLAYLNSEMVSAICRDGFGNLWFANSHGLLQYKDGAFQIFDNDDGLPSKAIPYRTLKADNKKHLWFGTIAGLGKGLVSNLKLASPKPIISSFLVSGVVSDFSKNVRYLDSEVLGFKIASPAYPTKHVKYRYQLGNNIEADWIDIRPGSNELILSNLATGDYELRLKACNIGFYEWSKSTVYHFEVYKVWYKRAWVLFVFYITILLLVGFYIFYVRWKNEKERLALESIIHERTKSLQERNEELYSLNEELNTANVKAEQAVKTKDKFFSIVAHDLKSPFNALIGISELLTNDSGNLPEETKVRLLNEMHETSENTYKLLHNLLDWARSQTGNIVVHSEELLINELIDEAVECVESNARQKKIEIIVLMDEPIMFSTDRSLLSTVLRNLVSNAIKFSDTGSQVVLRCQMLDGKLSILVKDNGIGIEPERMKDIFSLGKSRSTAGTENEKGTGLGLLLSYEFVLKLNGTIDVHSVPSFGTEFQIILPAQ